MQKFWDVVQRVELVRRNANLNKSQFAERMGLKPQTYNNFIGAQRSKPSIELIYGVVTQFRVNPHWLLNGTGSMWSPEEYAAANLAAASRLGRGLSGEASNGARAASDLHAAAGEIRAKLEAMRMLLSEIEFSLQALPN